MRQIKDISLKDVKFSIEGVSENDVRLDGLKISFNPQHEDKIHYKSTGEIVRVFPTDLSMTLDNKTTGVVFGLLLETVSSYLHSIRSKVISKDIVEVVTSRLDNKYGVRIRISKYFFREGDKARSKVSFAFFNLETQEEVVNISFSKRDVQVILSLFRSVTAEFDRDYGTFIVGKYVDSETKDLLETSQNINLAKIDNSIVIGDVWLHGQEILNMQYTINELVNTLQIESKLDSLRSKYRQVRLFEQDDILYLELSKMNDKHDSVWDKNLVIPLTRDFLAMFYLYANMDILSKIPENEFQDTDVDELSTKYEIFPGENIKFHVSMKESILSLAVRDRRKTDDKKMLLFGSAKSSAFCAPSENEGEPGLENFIISHASGDPVYVPLLQTFKIDLKDQWKKLLRALSMAYTQEYTKYRPRNLVKFFVLNVDQNGRFKYQFTISSDPANKAPAVLIIEKFKIENREEVFVGRYRQPLFKRYVYQLMTLIMTTAHEMDYVRFSEEFKSAELMSFSYKSFSRVQEVKKSKMIDYGIERNKDDKVLFGALNNPKLSTYLTNMDRALITASSEFKLLNGYWLPIVSEKIAISQDGYLRDMFSELNMEDPEHGFGVDWATVLYFGARV